MKFSYRSLSFTLGALLLGSAPTVLSQGIEDLWITEVNPSAGQIEVTNVSSGAITTTQAMAFCHRFNYGTRVPANTTFAPGESRLYSTTFSNQASSDLWIYRGTGGFGGAGNLLNGLQWGGTGGIGRASVAVSGGNWDATTSHAPSPGAGESLLLTGPDPFSAANWSVGPADLGNFVRNIPPIEVELSLDEGFANITWVGGLPPFQVLSSETLEPGSFTPLSGDLSERSFTVELAESSQRFFRVRQLENTATFEVSFRSAWSPLAFAEVPTDRSFGDIVGSVHGDSFSVWESGNLANSAFTALVRHAQPTSLVTQINDAITDGLAGGLINEVGVVEELGSRTFEITVDRNNPLLSLASALGASPDWFVGLENYSLLDANGDWRQSAEVALDVYDAGVDAGFGFDTPPFPEMPAVPIQSIQSNPLFTTPSLLLGFNSEAPAPPVAGLLIERIDNR